MDFFRISTREIEKGARKGTIEVFPDFIVGRSTDLMVRGRSFYAIWDEERGLWSTDEYDVQRLVDAELEAHAKKLEAEGISCTVKYLRSFGSNSWNQFRSFLNNVSDNSRQLDQSLTFENQEVTKTDYVSRRLPYPIAPGDFSAWEELVSTLYSVEERRKIEWAIGAVISGDSKHIQKFIVLYGPAGTGKSTILDIIQKLFTGYTTTFEAKALGSNNNAFATEVFKGNPLVAIQHDGDLSKIEDNTKLNSIISHEEMTMNEKYKPSYTARVNAFLFMGTNQPVKISDAKSGIIRRLIDVHPTGVKIPVNHYHTLMSQIDFELGAIAHHCLQVYRSLGRNYYNGYRPLEMMLQTDVFFNFIEANYDIFREQDGTTLKQAYGLYKDYCNDTGIDKVLPQYKVREELRNYFREFKDRAEVNGVQVRSYYSGFTAHPFKAPVKEENAFALVMEETTSIFDREYADQPAQYEVYDEETGQYRPQNKWQKVKSKLSDVDTSKVHFVRMPINHVVIDFDLKDDNGKKSLERNLAAASVWPATYAELSKSGSGVHLHYTYDGDTSELSSVFSDGIEVKVFHGDASLRRRLSKCNGVPIATLTSGLPKKEKKVLQASTIQSEKGLRDLIARNLKKEFHPGTKPSVDFIHKILEDAYESGMQYDVSDLRPKVIAFANNSTNRALECLKLVQKMKFKSADICMAGIEPWPYGHTKDKEENYNGEPVDTRLVFFDVEVYPNLLVVCWKYEGDADFVRMINPSPQDVEGLFRFKLVGYNCRRYDNHILYARYLGYNNQQLFELSQKLMQNDRNAGFGEAYNLSYADIWDFSSEKESLKKWEVMLGLHHIELDFPWDQPLDEKHWEEVLKYCCNDVHASEVVFNHRRADFVARQILAELSGLAVNDTTQRHTAVIIFGNDRNPQEKFVYTDLSREFPGYTFDMGRSSYRGEDPGEGGYVYAEPGMYDNVAVLDVASMHPTSIEVLNLFGPYTKNYSDLKSARLAIKHGDYETVRKMFDGRLAPHLENEADAKALSHALKIVINSVYGLTSARFNNPFRDNRNKDNIVAKRGALFMIDLKNAVQEQGFAVAHIKTDSIKIPNATPEIIDFVFNFGQKYGYDFEHEETYDRMCLVNDAVYIALSCSFHAGDQHDEKCWKAVGAQFQHPYVFKKLFSGEEITFDDYCETKQVMKGVMYLDFDVDRVFVGRCGRFVPVTERSGGGTLIRRHDDREYAVTGTKGYLWMEAEIAKERLKEDRLEIDMAYFNQLIDNAIKTIDYYGPYSSFIGR